MCYIGTLDALMPRRQTSTVTVAELREQAKELGLTAYSRLNKAELQALVERARQIMDNAPNQTFKVKSESDWSTVLDNDIMYISYQGRKYKKVPHQGVTEAINGNNDAIMAFFANVHDTHNILAVVGILDKSGPSTSKTRGQWSIIVHKIM